MTPPGDAVTWLGGRHIEALWAEEGGVTEHGGARIQEMVCISWYNYVSRGIFWGHALPVLDGGLHPTRVWRIIQGRTKADAPSQPLFVPRARRVSSGRKFNRATILGGRG